MVFLVIYPMFTMVLLTFVVGCIAVKARFSSVKNKTVSAKFYRLMDGQEVPDIITKTTRNLGCCGAFDKKESNDRVRAGARSCSTSRR